MHAVTYQLHFTLFISDTSTAPAIVTIATGSHVMGTPTENEVIHEIEGIIKHELYELEGISEGDYDIALIKVNLRGHS